MGKIIKENVNYLKIYLKNKETQKIEPRLVLNKKVGNEWVSENCDYGYEAEFISIKPFEYHSDEMGRDMRGIEIDMFDKDDGLVKLQAGWTNVTRSIVNSLAGVEGVIERIKISLYCTQKGDKTFPNASVYINGQKSKWKLDLEQQKEYITPVVNPDTGAVEKRSFKRMEDYFETLYEEINTKSAIQTKIETKVEEDSTETPLPF